MSSRATIFLLLVWGTVITPHHLFHSRKTKKLVSRFVIDKEGNRIGETISLDDDLVIIKKQNKYLAIPLKHIEYSKENVRIRGIIEWDKAILMGEQWRKKFK